jgi:energy-coupling factor transporter ATP-binding protein EcfA2
VNTSSQPYFEYPFGAESCEHEYAVLQDRYREFFYDLSRFNQEALEQDTYLIVGRRGSGKTSLTRYFEFQDKIQRTRCILVDVSDIYNTLNRRLGSHAYLNPDLVVGDVRRIWDVLFWLLIFSEYCEQDENLLDQIYRLIGIHQPCKEAGEIFQYIAKNYLDENGGITDELMQLQNDPEFQTARTTVLGITPNEPVIVAVDTFERYDRENEIMMSITAALIQSASDFNIRYARQGIHIKAFISSEIFPYIKEGNIPNTTKFIRNPVYMNWRPKDLVRLITWRFKKSLAFEGHAAGMMRVDWENFNEVRTRMWNPFFGEEVINLRGQPEQSLPYILRHTQMRPRQLVVLCNAIAREARNAGKYPNFREISIAQVIANAESDLADEVLNSYNRIYPGVADIAQEALAHTPAIFQGNYIDKVARKSSRFWPNNSYTAAGFRKLVAELGIVGRVRKKDERTGIIEADFEYFLKDRLVISDSDECVIHPMFYTKLQVVRDLPYIIYPFPDHPDYDELR